jgi:RNA polymerase sigma-70 factor (ECF subfamily)
MTEPDLSERLSRISTQWSVLFQAHRGAPDEIRSAQQQLAERYCGAVYRYLRALVRDADVADDLAQEFAVRFLRGQFHSADPKRGRFRDFLKTALRNLVIDHRRRVQGQPQPLPETLPEPADPAGRDELDRQFLDTWRTELLDRAWAALADHERQTGQPYHAVLRLRADRPELRSVQLAEELAARRGRPMSTAATRQLLHRARAQFATFLYDEVRQSLTGPAERDVDEELRELGLLEYCAPLAKRPGQR